MTDPAPSIELARSNLTAKLSELRRRESHVRSAISPLRYLANPWLHLGIAAFVGYRLGRRRPGAPSAPTMAGTIARAGVVALGEAIVRRVAIVLINESPVASK